MLFTLGVFDFLVQKQKLDYFAKEIIDAASFYGMTAGPVDERYDSLAAQFGIEPECDFSGTEYFNYNDKTVQLGETITLKLTLTRRNVFFTFVDFPVSICATASGLSEQYWKQSAFNG